MIRRWVSMALMISAYPFILIGLFLVSAAEYVSRERYF